MPDLKTAINIVEIIAATIALLVIGDYLGSKIGKWKLAGILGVILLIIIIAFAIYAAIKLA